MCSLQGTDLVGLKIRIPVYIQVALIFISLMQKKLNRSRMFGLITVLALVITSIHQYRTKNLHYIFQIEVTYLTSLLLIVISLANIKLAIIEREKKETESKRQDEIAGRELGDIGREEERQRKKNRKREKRFNKTLEYLDRFASYLTIGYNIWLWASIRWAWPLQECSNEVKVIWVAIPFDPSGWA